MYHFRIYSCGRATKNKYLNASAVSMTYRERPNVCVCQNNIEKESQTCKRICEVYEL